MQIHQTPLYEGKAKQIYAAADSGQVVVCYKDDASAYNGIKRANINNKGVLNNKISAIVYRVLERRGVRTHFISRIDDRCQLCLHKEKVMALEFVVRNYAAGSMSRRLQIREGMALSHPVYEICYKNDELNDPIIGEDHAVVLGLSTYEELREVHALVLNINALLIDIFNQIGVTMGEVKMEFGRLADEISPDTARLWDTATMERMDRDRFRHDMGRITKMYEEVLTRLQNKYGTE
jgi:phosphoribosylaminoimidazole-succinocarboxamide synthase